MDVTKVFQKATKRPVRVTVAKLTKENIDIVATWCHGKKAHSPDDGQECLMIETLEGRMRADIGSYVIEGVDGEFYPCRADIFEKTYILEGVTAIRVPSEIQVLRTGEFGRVCYNHEGQEGYPITDEQRAGVETRIVECLEQLGPNGIRRSAQ